MFPISQDPFAAWQQASPRTSAGAFDGEERGAGWKESRNPVYYSFSMAQGIVGHEAGYEAWSISTVSSIPWKGLFSCISDHFSRLQLKHGSIFDEFHEAAFLGWMWWFLNIFIVIRPQNSPLSLWASAGLFRGRWSSAVVCSDQGSAPRPWSWISKMWMKAVVWWDLAWPNLPSRHQMGFPRHEFCCNDFWWKPPFADHCTIDVLVDDFLSPGRVTATGPRTIVEFGTSNGFSAINWLSVAQGSVYNAEAFFGSQWVTFSLEVR